MKPIINLTLIMLFFAPQLFSQTTEIKYTYDAAGNRVTRRVVYLQEQRKADKKNAVASSATEESYMAEANKEESFLQHNLGESQIKVFPNPTQGKIMLEITGSNKNASVSVFDMSGKMVFSKKQFGSSGQIDLSRQPNGVYVMKVLVGDKVSEWELVKQ